MDAVSDPLVNEITVVASSQVGKTEMELNTIGYFVDQDPSSMLMVMPTLDLSQSFSKDRFDPMVRDTPCLRGKIVDVKQRDKSNTILHKKFPGGLIVMAGANSPASLASRPIRIVMFDEVDRYEASIGGKGNSEGDPISIGKKRAITYRHRKKYIYVSTPTISGVSRIMFSFEQSDQRHYTVPCPKCGTFQKLIFSKGSQYAGMSGGRIVFDESNLSWVYYECESCKAQLGEADKYKMVRAGRWEITKPEVVGHAGFHISELYSPWSSWKFMVEEFLKAKKRREALQVWVNTSLGETWNEEEAYTVSEESLLARREDYTKVPSGVVVLTVGADTQDDRLELVLKGWGLNNESWLIDYRVLYGTPTDRTVWTSLNEILTATYETEDGARLPIDCTCIDSAGHYTQEVYKFVRSCEGRRVFAIVGRAGPGRPLVGKMTRNNRERARMLPVGVDDAKTTIYRRLSLEAPQGGAAFASGYMHFPQTVEENYFSMLTAEKQIIGRSKGYPVKQWVKKSASARNESLDCEVYAMAALAILNPNWESLRKRLDERIARATEKAESGTQDAPPMENPRPRGGIRVVGQFG
jgi:phage terminase large subunit GpA-like protein